jgi:hypothetical protein
MRDIGLWHNKFNVSSGGHLKRHCLISSPPAAY